MKKYYLIDTFLFFVLSFFYLWPFFERHSRVTMPMFLATFFCGVLCYIILQRLFRFERVPSIFGAIVFAFGGLELIPAFLPGQRLYFGIFPVFLALLAFTGKKRKVFIIAFLIALSSIFYILAKLILFKVIANFSFSALSAFGLDCFLNGRCGLSAKKCENVMNFFRIAVMFIILAMFCLYVFLVFGGQAKFAIGIVNGFAWFTMFSIFGLIVAYLRNRLQRIEIILCIFFLTIIDIFTFWQGRFNL